MPAGYASASATCMQMGMHVYESVTGAFGVSSLSGRKLILMNDALIDCFAMDVNVMRDG
jgi:hypothetical protein